jgi:predicted Zn-dependent protease
MVEVRSVGMNPMVSGVTGSPVITGDGKVVGMCNLSEASASQRFVFAVPREPISAIIKKAAAAQTFYDFPKRGAIFPHGEHLDDPAYIQGIKLLAKLDAEGALEQFLTAFANSPKNPTVLGQVHYCLFSLERIPEARAFLQKALRSAPQNFNLMQRYGVTLNLEGDFEKTIAYARELTETHPEFAFGWGLLSENLLNTGQKAEAVAAMKKKTQLEPDAFSAWDDYAQVLSATGDFDGMTTARNRAVALESLFFDLQFSAPKRN